MPSPQDDAPLPSAVSQASSPGLLRLNKTMTTTVAEATELIELAAERSLKIVAWPGEVLRPQHQHVEQLIAKGALGQICWAVCGAAVGRYHEQAEFRSGDALSNVDLSRYLRTPGGGPRYDMTVYALQALTTTLGPAQRVTALSGTRVKQRTFRNQLIPTDADDNTLILLDFGDSLFALAYGTAAGSLTQGFSPSFF
jgi:predicted dehydrogenase